jgi:two-component system cell cycle sensor histidine kinase/response regulator CckA
MRASAITFESQPREKPEPFDGTGEDPGDRATPDRGRALAVVHPDLICTHDLAGRLYSVSAAACKAVGRSEAELLGTSILDLLSPSAAPGFAAYMETLRRDGFAIGTMKVPTSEGERRTWECRSTYDANAKPIPIVRGVARDVTERDEAYRNVRRSEEHFRSIIENASDIIAIVGPNGCVTYESPSVERVLGYEPEALLDRPFVDLIHPDDAGRAAAFLARQFADVGAIQTVELRLRHRHGLWRSFEVVAKNLIKKGKASAIVMNARDVTERKLLEAQLVQAQRLGGLGRLAATVAHEFNNVLMGMQPFAELIQRPDATSTMIRRGGLHIGNSIQRGKRIVLDILRFTQPYIPTLTAVDLADWWQTFSPEAEVVLGNMVEVVSTIPHVGLFALTDRTQLSQVMSNLVANASHAMPSGGRLTVEARVPESDATFPFGVVPHPARFVQISVTDTGHGMAPEIVERVFEPLFTTRQNGGTGLGLAVAHQVVTQQGGSIFVESEVGKGTTFHLFLPRAIHPSVNPNDPEARPRPAAKRLLFIEDEPVIVEGVAAVLAKDGIEVEGLGSGYGVVEALARFRPDVVVLDYGLPGMDGSEVYACIRKVDSSIAVIFATGHGDRQILQKNLGDSRTRFLQKPFEVGDLLEMMVELEVGGAP